MGRRPARHGISAVRANRGFRARNGWRSPSALATEQPAIGQGMTGVDPSRAVAMVAVGLSTVVEWYDFTLCLYFAPTLSRVFFGNDDKALGKTLAGFAIAYLMRPFGAILFGLFGDRLRPAADAAGVDGGDDADDAVPRLAANLRPSRLHGGRGADPDAMPHGIERRGRIYRRGRLSLRKRAISPKGSCHVPCGGDRARLAACWLPAPAQSWRAT